MAKKKASSISSSRKKLMKKKVRKKSPLDMLKGKKVKKNGNQRSQTLWDLYRDGVTWSMLSKFFVCRERFRLSSVEGWSSKKVSVPLEFGNLFHLLEENCVGGREPEDIKYIADEYAANKMLEDTSGYLSAEDEQQIECLAQMAYVTFKHHQRWWKMQPTFEKKQFEHGKYPVKDTYEKDLNFVDKEFEFCIPHEMPNGVTIKLRGKMDGVFQPWKGSGLWLKEIKTKNRIDIDHIRLGLFRDGQTGIYLYALMRKYNKVPSGLLYDVIRRTTAAPMKKESVSSFIARIEKNLLKRPEYYFTRIIKDEIEKDDITHFVNRCLNPALTDMIRWWESIKNNPFDPWVTEECTLVNKFSKSCKVCKGKGKAKDGEEECSCNKAIYETRLVENMNHYERPFGVYDSMAHGRGEYFDILSKDNYTYHFQRDVAFPELEEANDAR